MKHSACKWVLVWVCALAGAAAAQQAGHLGMPIDWSSRHVLYHTAVDPTFDQVSRQDPRILYGWMQGARARQQAAAAAVAHRTGVSATTPSRFSSPKSRIRPMNRPTTDWHFTLGAGTVAANMSPAKFTFDVNATPSCANDYEILGLNVAGSSTQPNLVGFTNLYSGTTGATFSLASATESGTTVTLTTTAANTFVTGNFVTISGVTPAGYNGTFQITVVNTTTFTYTDTAGLGAGTVTGATAVASGFCGVNPSVKWAYNVSTGGGKILTSPSLSLDGTKVAFIESGATSAIFHVLKLGTTGTNGSFNAGTNQYAAAQPDNTGVVNNAVLLSVTYTSSASNTRSSPFIDYHSDVAYFGDDAGNLYKTTCVFFCAGSVGIAAGWPVNVGAATALAPPVVDLSTNKIFVGGANGVLYMVPLASCPGAGCSAAILTSTVGSNLANGAIIDGVLLDNTFQTLFVTAGRNGAGASNAVQLNEGMVTLATISMSTNKYLIANGILDDEYFNNTLGGTTVTGNGYFCGPTTGSGQAGIFTVSFSATGTLSAANPPIMASLSTLNIPGNTAVACAPLLSFTSGGTERLFFSQAGVPRTACSGASTTDGCLFSYTITAATGAIAANTTTSEHGGTSGFVIDNVSTLPQASSLYFASQSTAAGSTSAPSCTYGSPAVAAFCAVKVTQSALQ